MGIALVMPRFHDDGDEPESDLPLDCAELAIRRKHLETQKALMKEGMADVMRQLEQLRSDRDAKKAAWDADHERSMEAMKAMVATAQEEVHMANEQMRRTQQSRQAISDVRAAAIERGIVTQAQPGRMSNSDD